MSKVGLLLLSAVLLSVGCGYGGNNYMGNGGMNGPQVTQLQPDLATAGGPAFVLTVNGTGFGTDAVVFWNSVAQSSTYMSSTQVTAQISAQDIMNAGMVPVYVRTGGRNSNMMNFDVQ